MPNPQYVTLVANVAQSVDLTQYVGSGATVKVTTNGSDTSDVYFTTDGTTATVGGNGCQVAQAGGMYETAAINRGAQPHYGCRRHGHRLPGLGGRGRLREGRGRLMPRPNAGDDSNPRSGEGGPRHTPAALAADPAFIGVKSGQRLVSLVGFIGDSLCAGTIGASVYGSGRTIQVGDNPPAHAMYASDGRWSNVINAGIGGQTSTQILARIQSDIITNGCTICVIVSCTMNDIGASIPTATTIANVKSMAAQLIAAGVVPVICSPTPYGRTGGTTPILTQIANVYQGVRDYAVRSGIPFVDLFGPLVDPATGTLATTYDASNGVHPNAAGYKVMGQAIQSALDSICPPRGDNLVRAANDPTDLLAGKGLFLTNTAGVGTGWSSTGTSGAVFSTVTDTGVLGNLQQIACTSTAGLALQDVQITGWSIGDLLEFSGLVTNSGGTSVPFIRFVVNGSPNPNTFPAVQPSAAVTRGRFRIAWAVPTGATTVYARFQMSAGTGTAAVGQLSVRNLTTLGITGP